MKILKLIPIVFALLMGSEIFGQSKVNHSGDYAYAVTNTPYGDFYGTIKLLHVNGEYTGEIINDEGRRFFIKFIRVKNDDLIFKSNIEDTKSIFYCKFSGDSLQAKVEVEGDNFVYVLKAKRENSQSKK